MEQNQSHVNKAGLPPGTLIYVGRKAKHQPKLNIFRYSPKELKESRDISWEDLEEHISSPGIKWINLDGVHQSEWIEKIGDRFNVHPLLLEDIMNTGQRPKTDEGDSYYFVSMNMIKLKQPNGTLEVEQVSFLLGTDFVISFQERPGDVFDAVRERLRSQRGRIRSRGADYLLFALMDVIVDHYFHATDYLEEKLHQLEEDAENTSSAAIPQELRRLKRSLLKVRKSVLPLREITNVLTTYESPLFDPTIKAFYKDIYDHVLQLVETIETAMILCTEIKEAYHTNMAQKGNQVMQVLTIIATIFIPLTFIAGVYGMNFEYMPELQWKYGYFTLLGIMTAVGVTLLIVFKRYKWL